MIHVSHLGDLVGALVGCLGFVTSIMLASYVVPRWPRRWAYTILVIGYIVAVLLSYWVNTIWS